MFDITKHKWSDREIYAQTMPDAGALRLSTYHKSRGGLELNQYDATAIAKHFNLLDCSSFGAVEPLNESVDIVFTDIVVPQPNTTNSGDDSEEHF